MIPCFWCGGRRDVHPVRIDGVFKWFLCAVCFHHWTDTGERPDMRPQAPEAGPITGLIVTPSLVREAFGRR